ncbi:MAG: hypothetical protein M0042_10495 [Nitrospiraceae bacterium]|nr:hypothetical protein [Nitrospiraceae bacterium]
MGDLPLYSIRMRAASGERHLSGAERIVHASELQSAAGQLIDRALGKGIAPERIVVTIDRLDPAGLRTLSSLDLLAIETDSVPSSRQLARSLLERAGVSSAAMDAAISALDAGPAPDGGNMRGAMIIDAATGLRLEQDQARGIRASRVDWTKDALKAVEGELAAIGLTHIRTREALALASKISRAPGLLAELCWSDDPDYTTGYVAWAALGYLRLPHLKAPGIAKGGRAWFVDRALFDHEAFRAFLEDVPVLLEHPGVFRRISSFEDVL